MMRAIVILQLGELAFQPVDALLGFFNDVKSTFEAAHPASEIQTLLLKPRTEFMDFLVAFRAKGSGPNDAATWRGHFRSPR